VLYPQDVDRVVTIDSVTSLHPMYTNWLRVPSSAHGHTAARHFLASRRLPQGRCACERHAVWVWRVLRPPTTLEHLGVFPRSLVDEHPVYNDSPRRPSRCRRRICALAELFVVDVNLPGKTRPPSTFNIFISHRIFRQNTVHLMLDSSYVQWWMLTNGLTNHVIW